MSSEQVAPYIVSSDLYGLMQRWSISSGYSLPQETFFKDMSRNLEDILKSCYNGNVEVISEFELRSGIEKLASKSSYPIVSMDRAYIDQNTPNIVHFLDLTRAVNENMEDIGLYPRPGYPSREQQMRTICNGQGPITLLDDVIFSGNGIVELAEEFERRGRQVKYVIAGVGISEGVKKLRDMGIQVECVREYENVVDEVCERDYYAGTPMSGRTVFDGNGRTWSAPYFRPFGKPEKWASIPAERVPDFSKFCLTQSLVLWAAIDKHSETNLLARALPRRLIGIPEDVSIVRALKDHIDNHKDVE